MSNLDVAIHLSATNGVSGVLAAIGKEMFGLQSGVGKLEEGFKKLRPAIVGAVTALAGIEALKFLGHIEEAGEGLVHAKTMLEAALPAQNKLTDSAKAFSAANKEAGENMRTTIQGNVEALHDLYTVTQSMGHSIELLPAFNSIKNAYGSANEKEGKGGEDNTRDVTLAIRGLELAGRNTAESLKRVTPQFEQMIIALRGRVTGEALQTQIGRSGDARFGWSDEFLTQRLPIMIATGLKNAGATLYQASNNLYGGVASSAFQGKFQEKWGIHKQEDELRDEKGKFRGFKVGSMWEADQFRLDPVVWANQFRDKLAGQGVDINNQKVMQDLIGEVGRGNKNVKQLLDEVLLPQTNRQQNKEFANVQGVEKGALGQINENDPKAWREALAHKTKDLKDVLGEGLVKPFLENVLIPLTKALRDLSQLAAANPTAVSNIMKGLAVVSAGIAAFGVVLAGAGIVAAIGIIGTVGTGIAVVSGAIVILGAAIKILSPETFSAWVNQIKTDLGGFKQAFDGFKNFKPGDIVSGIAKIFDGAMLGLPGLVEGAIKSAIGAIGSAISSAISSITGYTPAAGGEQAHGRGGVHPASPARGQKMGSLAPPAGGSKVAMGDVYLDGAKVGKTMDRRMAMNNRSVDSASGHDGRASWAHPEYAAG